MEVENSASQRRGWCLMQSLPQLSAAMAAAGIDYDGQFEVDDKVHRIKAKGDSERNSWYVLHGTNHFLAGAFGCWKRQITEKWCSLGKDTLSREDWAAASKTWRETESQRKAEETANFEEVRKKCSSLFLLASPCKSHPYLTAKSVKPYGNLRISNLELTDGWISIPLQDETGVIHSAQFIADDGTKRFFYQGRVAGCYFQLAEIPSTPLVICEGYATGATIHEATGWSVVCAMNCGNLAAVSKSIRKLHPSRMIIIAGDNDQFTDGNPGKTKGEDAAKSIRSTCVLPEFSDDSIGAKPTDFNDLALSGGLIEVKRQIQTAFPVHATPIGELKAPEKDDPTELLKYRFLSECGSLLICGPTGIGKSSFVMQALALWANSLDCFGIMPSKPLTSVLVQAENDDGDLAEMRDGVCNGLKFNEQQRLNFFNRVLVKSSTGRTGRQFCEDELAPLLSLHRPNLIVIDPALSFLGGDAKDQKDVGGFLRGMINPLLFQYRCACVMVHHTNKPLAGKEKNEWKNGEMAYLGSGSAEWANWARGVISMQSTGEHGLYKLHAAKRGSRLAWSDSDDNLIYEKIIAHSKVQGEICWSQGSLPEPENSGGPKGGRPNIIREVASSNLHEFCSACLPDGESQMAMARRLEFYLEKRRMDASVSTCKRIVAELVNSAKLDKRQGLYFKGPQA